MKVSFTKNGYVMNKQVIVLNNGTFRILGSDSITYYTVNRSGHCSCKGYGYRRKCRHIDLLKKKGLVNEKGISSIGYKQQKYIPKYIHDKKGFRVELVPA